MALVMAYVEILWRQTSVVDVGIQVQVYSVIHVHGAIFSLSHILQAHTVHII